MSENNHEYCCAHCGGTNVQITAWVNPNTEDIGDDYGDWDESDTKWCKDCEKNVLIVEENVETAKALVLSTSHMPEGKPDFGKRVRAVPHQHGYLVFLQSADALSIEDGDLAMVPQWLKPAVQFALKRECDYIDFESDGSIIETLTQWSWG